MRGIWIADVAWQGQSGILNEEKLGNDPSWHDHARDLLHMINHFRKDMVRPLVGIGHSFGGNIIVNLALLHPRLLSSLVLLDPVLSKFERRGQAYGLGPMKNSAFRRDLWPSRIEAAASFARNKFYSTWDPRVLALWNRYGLRGTPTPLYSSATPDSVTLTTTKHQECFTYYRPQAQVYSPTTGQRVRSSTPPTELAQIDKSKLVDADPSIIASDTSKFAFYRPEGNSCMDRLPNLRPGAMWIFGETSDVNPPDVRQEKMDLTGTGTGGSGGAKTGRVQSVTIEKLGHLVPMEATTRCAEIAADFLAKDLDVWREEERLFRAWAARPDREKQVLDEDWGRWLGPRQKL